MGVASKFAVARELQSAFPDDVTMPASLGAVHKSKSGKQYDYCNVPPGPPDGMESPTAASPCSAAFQLAEDSVILMFSFFQGHDVRATSPFLRDILDVRRPVAILGPVPLPAQLEYREPIGITRAGMTSVGYAMNSPMYKTVHVKTIQRQTRNPRSRAAERDGQKVRWEKTVTTSALSYTRHAADGSVEQKTAQDFWRGVLSFLRATEPGHSDFPVGPDFIAGGCSLHIRFGDGVEHRFEQVSRALLVQLGMLEACADQFC